ncbi:MAG: O-antigen ligase family protein, partial [Deltaproteobacteria bacterium]|nr:O-antigen ligase family protein [Deltaproteobacteria bacterium]
MILERFAFVLCFFVLLWSPLAFGAVHTTAYSFMILGVLTAGLLLAVAGISRDRKSGMLRFTVPATGLTPLFILFIVFLLLQALPLPGSLVESLSPGAWVVGYKSLPASQVVAGRGPDNPWFSLAPYTHPVLMSLVRWVAYGLFFLVFSRTLTTRKRIEKAIFAILILGCFESLYGLIQTFSGHEHIWWYNKTAYRGDVTGTYVNRNHFAGLMEMILMLAAAYTAALAGRPGHREKPQVRKTYLRARLAQWLSGEQHFNKRAFVLFLGVVTGIGLIFSASRGGMLGAAGGLLCAGLLFVFRQGHRLKGLIILVLFALISVYSLLIGAEYTASRFNYFESDMATRFRYAQRATGLFRDYSLTGAGIGNFQHAYPKYQAAEDRKVGILYAHNDWVQFLGEAGLIGVCLFVAGMLYFLFHTLRLWRSRRDPFAVCLGIAPFAAFAAVGIHSWSDFNLHIPANFLMLTAVTAIGYSALHLERRTHRDVSFFPLKSVPLRYKGLLLLVPLLALILWCGAVSVNHLLADSAHKDAKRSASEANHRPEPALFEAALVREPGNALYWYDWAESLRGARDRALRNPDLPAARRRTLQMEIVRALEEAVRLNPFREEYHIRLGWEYCP